MKIENFRFEGQVWDVTGLRMMMLRDVSRFGPVVMPIDDALMHSISLYDTPDAERIAQMEISRRDTPIIVVIQENGLGRVVDGNHRLLRKHRDACPSVECYIIPWTDAAPFVRPAD